MSNTTRLKGYSPGQGTDAVDRTLLTTVRGTGVWRNRNNNSQDIRKLERSANMSYLSISVDLFHFRQDGWLIRPSRLLEKVVSIDTLGQR